MRGASPRPIWTRELPFWWSRAGMGGHEESLRRTRWRSRWDIAGLLLRRTNHSEHGNHFNPSKRNRWIFGDRGTGAYLPKFAWTKIVRHSMVVGNASPDDPALTDYWTQRRRRQPPPAAERARPAPPWCPTRTMCDLRRASAACRPIPAKPPGMGAVGARHAGGDPQATRHHHGAWHVRF